MDILSISDLTVTTKHKISHDDHKSFLRNHADEAGFEGILLKKVPILKIIPAEIRGNIYKHLLGEEQTRIDITTLRGSTFQLRRGVPRLFNGPFKALLKVGNKTLYTEVKYFLHKSVTYLTENADTSECLPQILGIDVTLIHRLEVRMNWKMKFKHEAFWPRFLAAPQALPNLGYLRLYSIDEPGNHPYNEEASGDSEGTVTKRQQEVRALRLLGSFIVLRHKDLDVMIQTARSQPNFLDDRGRIVHEYELHKYDEDIPIKFNDGDQIINTKAVRRVKWMEGCHADPTSFWVKLENGQSKNSIKTSEATSIDDKYFRKLDARAYQTKEVLLTCGLNWKSHDTLVEECRKSRLEAARMGLQTAAPVGPASTKSIRGGGLAGRGDSTRGGENTYGISNTQRPGREQDFGQTTMQQQSGGCLRGRFGYQTRGRGLNGP